MDSQFQNIQEILYLSRKTKEADEKKFLLAKNLYELNSLSYENGSRSGDYLIRERVKDVCEEVNRHYDTVKLFDNGKSGDIKAYQEILEFNNKNFIDSSSIEIKLQLLKDEISKQEKADQEHNLEHSQSGHQRKRNLYVAELLKEIKILEYRLKIGVTQQLQNFLNDVNHILFCGQIILLIEDAHKRGKSSLYLNKTNEIPVFLKTFLFYHKKINNTEFSKTEMKEFIKSTLELMGLNEPLFIRVGATKLIMNEIIESVVNDSCASLRAETGNEIQGEEPAVTDIGNEDNILQVLLQVKKLIDKLCAVNEKETAPDLSGNAAVKGLGEKKSERYLFHEPGSFKITLKTIADYLNDSLIFVYSWIKQELKKNIIPVSYMAPLVYCFIYSENFIKEYRTALDISSEKSNQDSSFFEGELRQYIPKKLAQSLLELIGTNCSLLEDAFNDCSGIISQQPFRGSEAFIKKLLIVQESFIQARIRIIDGIKNIDPAIR